MWTAGEELLGEFFEAVEVLLVTIGTGDDEICYLDMLRALISCFIFWNSWGILKFAGGSYNICSDGLPVGG